MYRSLLGDGPKIGHGQEVSKVAQERVINQVREMIMFLKSW